MEQVPAVTAASEPAPPNGPSAPSAPSAPGAGPGAGPLGGFSAAVRAWFTASFPGPTPAQAGGWGPIAAGEHTLICAPTGSGKTLAAFLWAIDRLVTGPEPPPGAGTRVLYVSPLRALAYDVDKNLRAPMAGTRLAAERLGMPWRAPTVAMRTGDTPADQRRAQARRPADILITTPESLYLLLTSSARSGLAGVQAVIVDEIHALVPTKRGAHLAVSLERLAELCRRAGNAEPQRIGLSATQRPLSEVARYLGGSDDDGRARPVHVVDAGVRKPLDIQVVVPVEDMGDLGALVDEPVSGPAAAGPPRRSIWPSVHPRILDLILAHRSTIVFCNARRLAERLAARLNELAVETGAVPPEVELVKAHHGSLAREQRIVVEDDLKAGRLRAIVATSSLELGIDMGAVDLVVQVESPGAAATGLQRVGRAGHQVGEPSRGVVFPKHRGDLLEAAVVVRAMREGRIEATRALRNPLDVLAQQVVAMAAMDTWPVDDLARVVRRTAAFAELTDEVLGAVLDLLAGRYPSEEFRELRPRIVWDRVAGTVRARDGARMLAVTSGGTIPDRGLFGVFLPGGSRVGELDEEMVYESRPGEVFVLGASAWRIEDITFERVVVTPAPGEPGKMPFWHGDRVGRPLEVGRALGAFVREVRALAPAAAEAMLRTEYALDGWAAGNVVRYLAEQAEACGAVPDDRTVVVERFRDEIGDWRVCVLSPFGARVHAPWAIAVQARLAERWGAPVEVLWSDDGIVFRLPEAYDELPADELALDPDDVAAQVVAVLPSTSLFAARFRESAARALLLPRRRPDRRTPLWQQRQRAADLLAVAARYPSFPILLEATRECLQDVFDVPALREVLADIRARRVRVVAVDTPRPSPFAQSLLYGWIAQYMYEGDAPLAERRAAALALDRDLLRELLGAEELRELLDPEVLAQVELEVQRLADGRRARSADGVHDLLRLLGPLDDDEVAARCDDPAAAAGFVAELVRARRAFRTRVGGRDALAAAEDAGRLRDGLGAAVPVGLPAAYTAPVEHALRELVARVGAARGPFVAAEVAARLGAPAERVNGVLRELEAAGRVVHGAFRPGGEGLEWCDVDVLRTVRRRSLAALRREVEPVEPAALARFLPAWQGVGDARTGPDALVDTLAVLQGAAIPASVLEDDVLACRLPSFRPADLDALCTAGEVVWVGAGAIGTGDGRVRLFFRDQVAALAPDPPAEGLPQGPVHDGLRALLGARGACFWAELRAGAPGATDAELLAALWDLVWAGEVTNDSLAPVRAFLAGASKRTTYAEGDGGRRARPRPGRLTRLGPPAGAGRWSLVAHLVEPRPAPTERRHALALQLLERHGVVTREGVLAEGVEGGFAAVYPVLKALEERGQVRRGWFVAGLGAAQFALPGAVERLRSQRDPTGNSATKVTPGARNVADFDGDGDRGVGVVTLAATDPAQPYGATLAWPEPCGAARPSRVAGAIVVLRDGRPVAWFDRRGHSLVTFDPTVTTDVAGALAGLVANGRLRAVEVRRVDGAPALTAPAAGALRGAGFREGYRGLVLRSGSR